MRPGPDRERSTARRRLVRLAWTVAGAALLLLALRAFVGDVYPVNSPSMEPTIHTGEWVFVRFDDAPVERGEVVVVQRAGELIVKRALGVRPEGLRIDDYGDLLIDGRHAPPAPGARALVPLFDSAVEPIEGNFSMGGSQVDPWRHEGDAWVLDAREIPLGSHLGTMRYHPAIRDDLRMPDGSLHHGTESVGDVVLEVDLQAIELRGLLRFALVERGDTFVFTLELDGEQSIARLVRRFGADVEELLELPCSTGEWLRASPTIEGGATFRVRFENIDDQLRVSLRDEAGEERFVTTASYPGNHMHPQDHQRRGLSFGHRAQFGGEGCFLRVLAVRIWRDLHYTKTGTFAVETECQLDPGELFLLGDNSIASRDSREWGPIKTSALIGRASAVIWPPSRWRWIRAGE